MLSALEILNAHNKVKSFRTLIDLKPNHPYYIQHVIERIADFGPSILLETRDGDLPILLPQRSAAGMIPQIAFINKSIRDDQNYYLKTEPKKDQEPDIRYKFYNDCGNNNDTDEEEQEEEDDDDDDDEEKPLLPHPTKKKSNVSNKLKNLVIL